MKLQKNALINAHQKEKILTNTSNTAEGEDQDGRKSKIENQEAEIENEPASPVCYANVSEVQDEYRIMNSGLRPGK